ncbi:hypothetical protein PVAP13_3NG134800 [Panicum virgatum]|uniref:DUF4220 domain-containing protein n=1 Tax=Panicum virgatum TaxID=38727 RepID=A0A8T0UCU2_PANVG|nr:hypothetical protein PVAP13_3NG134800 [Panicum virgatum]
MQRVTRTSFPNLSDILAYILPSGSVIITAELNKIGNTSTSRRPKQSKSSPSYILPSCPVCPRLRARSSQIFSSRLVCCKPAPPQPAFMMPRALRENGAAAVSMAVIHYSTLFVVVTATLSLETKLTALSLALGGLYLVQRVLVGKRRRSGHWLVQYGAMAAYYLPSPLAFCAAQAVCSTTHIDESTPFLVAGILGMFELSIRSDRDVPLVTSMRAYSVLDRPRDGYNYLMRLVFLGWVFLQWAWSPGCNWWWALLGLTGTGARFVGAYGALFDYISYSTLDCQTKAVADYMMRESSNSSTSSPFFDDDDANSNSSLQLLDRCRYPFVQGGNGEWVTVKDLVQRDDLPNVDKDIWLSYSLCRLLARRYYGFRCAEEGDDKVRRFALADPGTTGDYKRAFTIVEVQLAFLHDYFFTASLPIIESGSKYIEDAQTLMRALSTIIFSIITSKANIIPTLIASSMRNPNALDVLDPFQAQTGGAYWRNKIGQYSILQDYDRRRSLKKKLVAWFQRTMLSQPLYEFIKHLPVEEEEEVDMLELDSMRKLVADTLRDIDGPPTNGTRSLKINMDEINRDEISRGSAGYDWLLTCKQETHTDTILIWHIATCYCDMSLRHSDQQEEFPRLAEIDTFHKAATTLSRYCANLVAFLPEFLPDHSLTIKHKCFRESYRKHRVH